MPLPEKEIMMVTDEQVTELIDNFVHVVENTTQIVNNTTKPSRYSYNVPRQAITILRDVMIMGKVKHPKNDGWKRSTGYHVWCSFLHILWYALTWKEYHIKHAFARCMMALGVKNGWK